MGGDSGRGNVLNATNLTQPSLEAKSRRSSLACSYDCGATKTGGTVACQYIRTIAETFLPAA
jgi:hypothetical protein